MSFSLHHILSSFTFHTNWTDSVISLFSDFVSSLQSFPTEILYVFLITSVRIIYILDLRTVMTLGEDCTLWSSWLCSFLQSPPYSFFLAPNTSLRTLFSYIHSVNLRPSLEARQIAAFLQNHRWNYISDIVYRVLFVYLHIFLYDMFQSLYL
jgi:hypothetical protein